MILVAEELLIKWPTLRAPLHEFITLTPAGQWPESKIAKTKVNCLITTNCYDDPSTPLARLLARKSHYHPALNSHGFQRVADWLTSVAQNRIRSA